jgi:nucleoside-diphosphate-sugar epimerase
LNLTLKSRDETIKPAVEGTLGLLKSAYNSAGLKLCNIVVTGSVASVMGITPIPGKVYTEEDFDTETERLVEGAADNPSPNLLYYTSKILAEKALWNFVKDFKVSFFNFVLSISRFPDQPKHSQHFPWFQSFPASPSAHQFN